MIYLPLKTERLLLRDLCEEDINNVYNLFSNPEVMYFLDLPHSNIEHTKRYIENLLKKYQEYPRRCYEMAVILADTHLFIGIVSLEVETSNLRDGRSDLSYYFLPEFWHKKYATEASKTLIKFGFEVLSVNKITAGCLKCNSKSEKVMIQCNMQKEAEFKKHTQFNGEWVNRVEYAILKDEYFLKYKINNLGGIHKIIW
ncbi:MAG: GNAT family N-acetyltransferase [Oscillospiraceae bacterium]|nr:GNAT family N-acetyltransferase [Oscillospiraceae bacterium]